MVAERKCTMFGCSNPHYNSISLGPGTYLGLCQDHYSEIAKEKSYGDSDDRGIQTDAEGLADLD